MSTDPLQKPNGNEVPPSAHDDAEALDGVTFETSKRIAGTPSPDTRPDLSHPASGKHMFDVESAYNDESVQIGTIVTDKKRSRMSFGQMLQSAFNEWWTNAQETAKHSTTKLDFLKPKESPTVEVPETRSTVIQEAARLAQQAPRDDHAVVVEKIRTFAHDAELVTGRSFVVKPAMDPALSSQSWAEKEEPQSSKPSLPDQPAHEKEPVEAPRLRVDREPFPTPQSSLASYALRDTAAANRTSPVSVPAFTVSPAVKKSSSSQARGKELSWTHFTDAHPAATVTAPTLRESMPEVIRVPIAPRQRPFEESRNESPASTPQSESAKPLTPPTQERAPSETVSVHPAQTLTSPAISPSLESSIPAPTLRPTSSSAPQIRSISPVSQETHRSVALWKTFGIIGIVVLGVGLGIFSALLFVEQRESSSDPIVSGPVPVPSFLSTDTTLPIPLPFTRDELLKTLAVEADRGGDGVTHFYPVVTTSEGAAPARTEAVMRVLSPHTDGSFIRSLEDTLMFGSVGVSHAPYIVLRSVNFDVAFAGMLSWEPDMSRDLAPFFGTPVLGTIPPAGSSATTQPHFLDALKSNRSIRVLYDEAGKERIVYAFVNDNLIIITTSTEALSNLIERIK